MSMYYTPKRTSNLYDPTNSKIFRISRSKIDLFLNCPKCFYLDRKLGIGQPPSYPYNLNSAVDKLLKKEFDLYRKNKTPHPLMKIYGIKAVPFIHANLEKWRDSLRAGISYKIPGTNIEICGGVDDIWVNEDGELHIVDYKSTSKDQEVTLDAEWQIAYKRQVEIYQWLFRKNGFKVSDTSYFVYCNGNTENEVFDGKLEFDIKIISYEGSDAWIEKTIDKMINTLNSPNIPASSVDCDYCKFIKEASIYY